VAHSNNDDDDDRILFTKLFKTNDINTAALCHMQFYF